MVEITSGLSDGDRIVTVGQVGLKDDAVVTIINDEDEDVIELAEEQMSDDAPTN